MSASKMVLGVLGLCVGLGAGAGAQSGASTQQERANELQSRYMTVVKAELTSKLDVKTAVAGQVLTAKTHDAVTLADGTAIPAGTKLVGRVINVHPRTDERAESVVTVTFDRAEMKDGKTLPVRSLIRGMSTPGAPQAAVTTDPTAAGRGRSTGPIGPGGMGTDPIGGGGIGGDPTGGYGGDPGMGGSASSRGGMGGGGMGGGGMGGGGMGGGGIGGVGTTGPNVGTTRGGRQVPQQPVARLPLPDAPVAEPAKSTAEGGETVRITPKPTGVPGVLLYANPASDISGMLMEYDKNIHLDSGVMLTLGVISRQPAAADPVAK